MDNRRPPTNSTMPPRPQNQNGGYRSNTDGRSFDSRRPPVRDNQSQPRDNRFQPRNDNRFQNRTENSPPGDNRFQPRDGGGGGRFQPRNGDGGGFQPRERFAPKGKFLKPWERDRPLPPIVSEMQVTDGKHRGKYLQSTASEKVRPTARRVREVMFRILHRRIRAGRFLDLCAGSGMVGIEAVSRGAMVASFVERSAKMCSFIKKNMESCGIKEGHGEVFQIEVIPFLKQMLRRKRTWDVVYFDPPYDSNYDEVFAYFSRGAAIKPKGVLIVEHHADMFFPEKFGVMTRWRVLVQGETALSFYSRN